MAVCESCTDIDCPPIAMYTGTVMLLLLLSLSPTVARQVWELKPAGLTLKATIPGEDGDAVPVGVTTFSQFPQFAFCAAAWNVTLPPPLFTTTTCCRSDPEPCG